MNRRSLVPEKFNSIILRAFTYKKIEYKVILKIFTGIISKYQQLMRHSLCS